MSQSRTNRSQKPEGIPLTPHSITPTLREAVPAGFDPAGFDSAQPASSPITPSPHHSPPFTLYPLPSTPSPPQQRYP